MGAARRGIGLVAAAVCAFAIAAHAQVPSSGALGDVARDLAARIAATVGQPDELHVTANDTAGSAAREARAVIRDVSAALRARGFKVVDQPTDRAITVRIGCAANLREWLCSADVRKGDSRDVVMAARPHAPAGAPSSSPIAALAVRPLFASQTRLLDVIDLGGRLLVLDGSALTLYARGDGGWTAVASAALPRTVVPPRDLRGRLVTSGQTVQAFLPGLVCRGTLDPLHVDCATTPRSGDAPAGFPNAVFAPRANYFTAPNTPPFFTAATLGADGGGGWLVTGVDGRLLYLDASLGAPIALPGVGDDIARVAPGCGSGPYVLAAVSRRDTGGADALRAYDVVEHELVPVTPPVEMPGAVTALWTLPDGSTALVIVHNVGERRYEAFSVGVSCAR